MAGTNCLYSQIWITIQETTENYSIVSVRNIAKKEGLRSVFRADHSMLGDIVVKVVTERSGPASSIPKIARNWLNEVRSMRDHDHVNYSHLNVHTPNVPNTNERYKSLLSSSFMDRMLDFILFIWSICHTPILQLLRGRMHRRVR